MGWFSAARLMAGLIRISSQVDARLRCSTDGALPALAEDVYGPMSGQVSSAVLAA